MCGSVYVLILLYTNTTVLQAFYLLLGTTSALNCEHTMCRSVDPSIGPMVLMRARQCGYILDICSVFQIDQ